MEFFKKETHIDFMRIRWITLGISLVVIAAGAVSYFAKGGLTYGVDFAGGTMVQLKFKDAQDIGTLRAKIQKMGFSGSRLQELEGENEFLLRIEQSKKEGVAQSAEELDELRVRVIRGFQADAEKQQIAGGLFDLNTMGLDRLSPLLERYVPPTGAAGPRDIAAAILDARTSRGGMFHSVDELKSIPGVTDAVFTGVKKSVYLGEMSVIRTEIVGPQIGKELRHKGMLATIWALIGMLIYVTVRFQFVYGLSVILTLTHDVLVTVGLVSIFNLDFDLTVLAAVLTIVGFSVNDTIVIFDRIRENLKIMKKDSLEDISNKSINQTLSRTILTSGTVFVTVVALFFFGGDVIHPFAFTMLVGVISGSYSTIYISCPILLWWKKITELRSSRRSSKR